MDGRRRRYLPGAANVEPRLTVLQAALFTDVCIAGIFFVVSAQTQLGGLSR